MNPFSQPGRSTARSMPMHSLPACWVGLHSPSSLQDDEELGRWALSFTPRVARLHGVWVMDVTHSLRLWGGVPRLLERLRQGGLAGQAWTALHLALGPSAWAARSRVLTQPTASTGADARWHAAPSWQSPHSLADLSLNTLPDLAAQCPVWERLGVTTWGHLNRLPRAGVVRRWGHTVLQTLDQAMGRIPCPLPWLQMPEGFDQTLELAHATEHTAALAAPMGHLLHDLHGWLAHRQLGAWALRWLLHHDPRRDGPLAEVLEMRFSQPVQSPDLLQRLSQERLQQLALSAPVVRLGLQLLQTQPWREALGADLFDLARQPDAHGPQTRLQHTWPGLLDQLRARLGQEGVVQWHSQDTPLAEASQAPVHQGVLPAHAASMPARLPPWAWVQPTWLARPPRPLPVRGGLPQFQGALQLLSGPHRVEWQPWNDADPTPRVRDHHLAHSPGAGLVWVCREPAPTAPTWWLLGWWA